jgi:hypothetical protein
MSFSAFTALRSKWIRRASVAVLSGFTACSLANIAPKIRLDEVQLPEVNESERAKQLALSTRLEHIKSATEFCDFADSSPSG